MATKKKAANKGVQSSNVVSSSRPMRVTNRRFSRSRPMAKLWGFIVWVVGVLVSLAVGFGMVNGVLVVPYVHTLVMQFAGWLVVLLTLFGVLFKLIDLVI